MNHLLPFVTYPAIKQLLWNRLQTALGLYVLDASELHQVEKRIPLHRAKDCRRTLYVSAIALQLSQARNMPALEIATGLAKLVQEGQDFTVRVVPPGWIHLELTEPKLAAWLQRLALGGNQGQVAINYDLHSCTYDFPEGAVPPSSSSLFAVQYAHARCCSLVQMAHREGLITFREPQDAPGPLHWLNSNQQLCLVHLAERALIAQLVGLLDDLYCPGGEGKMIDWEKAALNLSQAFQTFYSCCRIWGEVKIQTPHLAQARLGLVMATQSVLRLLLEDLFGVCAPPEL